MCSETDVRIVSALLSWAVSSEQVFQVFDFVREQVEFVAEGLDFGFAAAIDFEVEFTAEAVFGVGSVLTHHDDRGLEGGEHGEEEIEQDEGVRIPGTGSEEDAEAGIDDEAAQEGEDELPGAAEAGYGVCDALSPSGFFFDERVGIAAGAHLDEALGGVELAAHHGEHVEAGLGLAFEKDSDVVAVNLEAGGLFCSHGVGLVRGLVEHGGEAEEAAVGGLVDENFLLVFVKGGDADVAGEENVGAQGGIADFEDALAGGEAGDFDLGGEDG